MCADHRAKLAAIDPDLAAQCGVLCVHDAKDLPESAPDYWANKLPAIVFWYRMNGRVVPQLRPDNPEDGGKYLFPDESEPPLNCVRDPGGNGPVLIVEGTKQHLSAASYADEALAIYGMFGCWGWSGRDLSFTKGRLVYIAFDADMASNRDVWNAATEIRKALKAHKAAGVRFVSVPGSGSTGLDDFLATTTDRRTRRRMEADMTEDPRRNHPPSWASLYDDQNANLNVFGDLGSSHHPDERSTAHQHADKRQRRTMEATTVGAWT